MKDYKKKVLIVGAGIAGLAMYIALDKKKFDIEIVERRKKFERLGYALIFMPSGFRALRMLRFSHSQIRSLGMRVQENREQNKDGKLTLVTDFRALIKKFGPYMLITRERLYRLLESKVSMKNIRFGVQVRGIRQKPNGKVRVRIGSGQIKEYDVVIGADGEHSLVRQSLFHSARLKSLGFSLIWAWIPRKENIYPRQSGTIGTAKTGIGFFNSGEAKVSCMAFFLGTKDTPRVITPKAYTRLLRNKYREFKGIVPRILKNLPPAKEMYLHKDYELNLKKWHKGNTVLIGDAAHTRSVFSGAGSALALEDALILGTFLNKESTTEHAIERYFKKQKSQINKLAISKLSLYIQNQKGVVAYLKDFLSSSLLYKKNWP